MVVAAIVKCAESNPIITDESLLAQQGTAAVRKGVVGSAM